MLGSISAHTPGAVFEFNETGSADGDQTRSPGYIDDKEALVGLLDGHARHCVIGASASNREAKTEEMMGAVARLLRS